MGSLSCSIISLAGGDSDGSVNDLYAASNSSSRSLSDSSSSLRMIVEASSRMRFTPSFWDFCGRSASSHLLELWWVTESGDGRRTRKTIRTRRLSGSSAARRATLMTSVTISGRASA